MSSADALAIRYNDLTPVLRNLPSLGTRALSWPHARDASCKEQRMQRLWVLAVLALTAGRLGAGEPQPSREAAVKVLRDFVAALETKDYDKALRSMQLPAALKGKEAAVKARLAKLLGSPDLSRAGAETLVAKGRWGQLAEVLSAKQAEARARLFEVPLGACYGLVQPPTAIAVFVWDGTRFRIALVSNAGHGEKGKTPPSSSSSVR